MTVPILSCPCGLRMKAKGATPGRVGRCPKCGRTITVSGAPEPEIETPRTEPSALGYGVAPTFRPVAGTVEGRPPRERSKRRSAEPSKLPEVATEVEPWWRPDLLFPLRGAEGLMIVVMLALAFWGVTVLTPELCLTFVADAGKFGATLLGLLFAMIAALPGLLLGFFAVVYLLQYLGRVLVASAMGEVLPPRPPDRNFDGLFNGLSPWVIWLACGASLGFGPALAYLFSRSGESPANVAVVALLAIVGLPYALMALMMTFLHHDGMPRPFVVVWALLRFNLGFLGLCAVEAGLAVVVVETFVAVLWLREKSYGAYVLLMLPAWMLALWSAIVAMRILGVFYHHHASILRWHREKPWWGVSWER